MGIDIDPSRLQAARDAGYNAISADLTDSMQFEGTVDFCLMFHFLEHLPSFNVAKKCVETALEASDRFIFVCQPWFDSDGILFDLGLKFYWSDWRGHSNPLSSLQCYRMFSRHLENGDLARLIIAGSNRILDSSHNAVHPVTAPTDQHEYDEVKHGHKDYSVFPFKTYREIVVVATKSLDDDPVSLAEKMGQIEVIFDSKVIPPAP